MRAVVVSVFVERAPDGLPALAALEALAGAAGSAEVGARAHLGVILTELTSDSVVWREWPALWEAVAVAESPEPPTLAASLEQILSVPGGRALLDDAGLLLGEDVNVGRREPARVVEREGPASKSVVIHDVLPSPGGVTGETVLLSVDGRRLRCERWSTSTAQGEDWFDAEGSAVPPLSDSVVQQVDAVVEHFWQLWDERLAPILTGLVAEAAKCAR